MKTCQKTLLPLLLVVCLFCLFSPGLTVHAEGKASVSSSDAAPAKDATSAILSLLPTLAKANPSKKAEQVTLTVKNAADDKKYGEVLDNDETTYVTLKKKENILDITSERAFENLYVKLEMACEWTLTLPDGTESGGGKNGFIHEYMPLGQAVTSVKLSLPKGAMLTDVYAFTDGQPPAWVQVWEPPCEKADLLVLPTHADDEHLWFGGAMPYYAGELGYEVQVVYMTNHYNTTYRNHEQLNGLWTVGVTHYPVIGKFLDVVSTKKSLEAAQTRYGYQNVLKFQVEILRRFAPRVIIAHDINGEYGHGAHILNAVTLLDALEKTDDPKIFPESAEKYGTCKVQKCYLHLWSKNKIVVDWGKMPLEHFGGKTALEMAKEGFACHVSQVTYYSVEDFGENDCRKFGLAYTTVGNDSENENDMFEHVDWSDKTAAQQVQETAAAADTPADIPAEPSETVSPTDEPIVSPSNIENTTIENTTPADAISTADEPSSDFRDSDEFKMIFIGSVMTILLAAAAVVCVLYARQRK